MSIYRKQKHHYQSELWDEIEGEVQRKLICTCICVWFTAPKQDLTLPPLTNTAALTTQQINIVFLIAKRAILLLLRCTTVVYVPLRGGPTVWQTKADSKNRQWCSGCLSSQWLQRSASLLDTHQSHRLQAEMCTQASLSASTTTTNRINAVRSRNYDCEQMLWL